SPARPRRIDQSTWRHWWISQVLSGPGTRTSDSFKSRAQKKDGAQGSRGRQSRVTVIVISLPRSQTPVGPRTFAKLLFRVRLDATSRSAHSKQEFRGRAFPNTRLGTRGKTA